MKRCLFAALAGFAGLIVSASAADSAPAISINQALKIAQDYLKDRAPDRTVSALALESSSFSKRVWYARWSSPVVEAGKKETGLRIDMDGSLTRIVEGDGAPAVRQQQQRVGARNIR